ncbi:TAT-variant-translocated molybdopterin oxidoreductase [Mycobacterium sp.]
MELVKWAENEFPTAVKSLDFNGSGLHRRGFVKRHKRRSWKL